MNGNTMPLDFTEASYAAVLDKARARFQFCRLKDAEQGGRIALWRHDIDFSPQRALSMARIEASAGVMASYFVLLGSAFYNPFESAVSAILRDIAELGHDIGLHYDASTTVGDTADHVSRIEFEAETLGRHLGVPFASFSIHNPSVSPYVRLDERRYNALINASAPSLRSQFTYISDSNGRWRFRTLDDVLDDPSTSRLYALTHPEWWTPEALPPTARVERCIAGRARNVAADYQAFLTRHRPEVIADD